MTPVMPGRSGLLIQTAAAAAVAAFLVFCVVLPAEYRKDPTGFGRLTGLLDLSTPHALPVPAAPSGVPAAASPSPSQFTWFFPAPYKNDSIQIPLKGDGEVEYKIKMRAGDVLIYNWQSDTGNVYYDFHGEPPNNPKGSQTYKKGEEVRSEYGAFVAPFDGIHGWFWLNLTEHPIKITLKISGFYESHDFVK